MVEIKAPPMMAMAMGLSDSEPGPSESAKGIAPATVEKVVIKIGLSRLGHASSSASRIERPSSRF